MKNPFKFTRRGLFPLAGLAPFGFAVVPELPQFEPMASHALRVVMMFARGKWVVCVPDYDQMEGTEYVMGWQPGQVPQWKWMPLEEYLNEVERACDIKGARV